MNVNIQHMPVNILSIWFNIMGWGMIILWIIIRYRKQKEKPAIWKAVLAALAGIISFSWNMMLMDMVVRIAVLPLGVWLLHFFLRKHRYEMYRPYAWIGFWSNYIFLAAMLLSTMIHSVMYPINNADTYLAHVEQAVLIPTHPTAPQAVLHPKQLQSLIPKLKQAEDQTYTWYSQSSIKGNPDYQMERFPYVVINTHARWGSGLQSMVNLERDGKGLLITTEKRQFYYRSEEPLVEMGGGE